MLQQLEHKPFRGNPYFEQYVDFLISLHDAMRHGDEDEAERLREQMDAPGLHLNEDEIQWVKGLSSDLYMLDDDESFRPLDRTPLQLITDIKAAMEHSDGEAVLLLLRRADFVSAEHRAWFRSRAYEMLGYYNLSLRFLAYASDLAPEHFEYNYMLLAKMVQQGDLSYARQVASRFLELPSQPPKLKIISAVAFCSATEDLPSAESRPFLMQATEVINSLMTPEQQTALPADDALMAWMILADAYFKLGETDNAIMADDKAVSIAPGNPYALEERGRHRLGTDRQGALEDFLAAADSGSRLPFPYLFVIREYLLQGKYTAAKDYSQRLISQTHALRVQAQAWEFLALAYHGLQYPASEVDEAYRRAIALSPENPRRKQNYDAVRASMLGVGDAPQINLPTLTPEEVQAMSALEAVPAGRYTSDTSVSLGLLSAYSQQSFDSFTEKILSEDYAAAA